MKAKPKAKRKREWKAWAVVDIDFRDPVLRDTREDARFYVKYCGGRVIRVSVREI